MIGDSMTIWLNRDGTVSIQIDNEDGDILSLTRHWPDHLIVHDERPKPRRWWRR